MNDFWFWKNYNKDVRKKIDKLLEKDEIHIDMHIHSNYSTDGKQSLKDLIKNCQEKKFDIISITDHDDIRVYDELHELISNGELEYPIIVPGVEFTVECEEYGSQCHILQYYINPKDENFVKYIKKNEEASWTRVKKQFKRINENNVLNELKNKKGLQLSIEEYKKFLIDERLYTPEYTTLAEYIKYKINAIDVDVMQLFDMIEEDNKLDICIERKNKKEERYKYLRKKYTNINEAKNSTRLLLSIIAPRGVDDDFYKEYKSSGSLSVNYYEQLKINELSNKFPTVFAHPTYEKLNIIENIEKFNQNIVGVEENVRNMYNEKQKKEFYRIAKEKGLIVTLGSDSHDDSGEYYKDMNFFIANKTNIKRLNEWGVLC